MAQIIIDVPNGNYTLPDGSVDTIPSVLVDAFAYQFDYPNQKNVGETKMQFALRKHEEMLKRVFRQYILFLKSQTITGVEDVDPGIVAT